MKKNFVITLCAVAVALCGCATEEENYISEVLDVEIEADTEIDESIYIGEYLDYDVSEPNLEIAKGEDGKYIVASNAGENSVSLFEINPLSDKRSRTLYGVGSYG